ncbi:MAG: hypothetical protein ACYTEL_07580 [Planctomycetota bacterium]|jgi:hypothetical protein
MRYQVVGSDALITNDSVVIDSSGLPIDRSYVRIDHHVDNGWTNLDSVWKDTARSPLTVPQRMPSKIVTNYLDPDAIISAAVLSLMAEQKIERNFWDSEICKVLYSASFWCDYQCACPFLDAGVNNLGDKMEIWLREQLNTQLGEDRSRDSEMKYEKQSQVFDSLVHAVSDVVEFNDVPVAILEIDTADYLRMMREEFARFVREDLSSNSFGVIHIVGATKRVIPRSYFPLFNQPVILRVIQKQPGGNEPKQVLIGVNPTIRGWEEFDLLRLNEKIASVKGAWSFSGRRYLIGTSGQHGRLEELMDIVTRISLKDIKSASPMWSFLQ